MLAAIVVLLGSGLSTAGFLWMRQAAQASPTPPTIPPALYLVGGLGFSFLAGISVLTLGRRAELLARKARLRNEQLRTATDRIQTSEERFRTYMDHTPLAAWLLDGDLRLRFANKRFRSLFHINPDKTVSGMTHMDFLPQSLAEHLSAADRKALEGGKKLETMERFPDPEQGLRRWLVTRFPFPGEDGRPWLGCTAMDITEREEAINDLAESEQRLKSIGDNLPQTMLYECSILHDGSMTFQYLSAGVKHVTGRTPQEIYEDPTAAYANVIEDDAADLRRMFTFGGRDRLPFRLEYRRRREDGEIRWFQARAMPRNLPDGSTVWDGVETDITEHVRNERLLAWERDGLGLIAGSMPLHELLTQLLRGLEQLCPGAICSVLLADKDGSRLRHGAGPSLPETYTCMADDIPIGPSAGSCGTAAFRRQPVIVEDISTDPLWLHGRKAALDHGLRACWSTPVLDRSGSVLGTFAVYYREPRRPLPAERDLTDRAAQMVRIAIERRKVEDDLHREHALLRTLIDSLHECIYVKDTEGRFILINEANRKTLGLDRATDAIGKSVQEFFPGNIAAIYEQDDLQVMRSRQAIYEREEPFVDASGRSGTYLTSKMPLFSKEGAVLGIVGVSRDITGRKRAEEELRRLTASLEHAQATARLGSWELDPSTGQGWWSSEMYHLFGMDPSDGCPSFEQFLEIIHPEDREEIRACFGRAVKTGLKDVVRFRVADLRGSVRYFEGVAHPVSDESGEVIRLTGTAQDITERVHAEHERQNMQRKLEETQRLESLGVLAGGIAHDFNNLLTVILGNASLIRLELDSDSPLQPCLSEIMSASTRAADLCRQMLAYSGHVRMSTQPVDLSALIRESEPLLRSALGKAVRLNLTLDASLPPVAGDEGQLRQILLSLVTNASEAIGQHEGEIQAGTRMVALSAEDIRHLQFPNNLSPGPHAALVVTDTGPGMAPSVMSRIFDPFYTTKFMGRGLGLAAVQGIVRVHKGGLNVQSKPGEGSTFTIYLPFAETMPHSPAGQASTPRTGGGVVLVIDDEEAVRHVTRRLLEAEGCNVMTAADGVEGIEKFRRMQETVDLVLLDLTMPRMGGVQTFHLLRSIKPDVKVLLMSGYTEEEAVSQFTGEGLAGFIQKPFSNDELKQKLSSIMSAGRPSPDGTRA